MIHKELNHVNVVQMHHYFEDNLNVYMLLEACPRKVSRVFYLLDHLSSLTTCSIRSRKNLVSLPSAFMAIPAANEAEAQPSLPFCCFLFNSPAVLFTCADLHIHEMNARIYVQGARKVRNNLISRKGSIL